MALEGSEMSKLNFCEVKVFLMVRDVRRSPPALHFVPGLSRGYVRIRNIILIKRRSCVSRMLMVVHLIFRQAVVAYELLTTEQVQANSSI